MKLYRVNAIVTASAEVLIAAETKEQAEEMVEKFEMEDVEAYANLDLNDVDGAEAEEDEKDPDTGDYIADTTDACNYDELSDDEKGDLMAGGR